MNQLRTNTNGGFPFVLDDLRWMDSAYRDTFTSIFSYLKDAGLGSGVPQTSFIISGCEIVHNAPNYDIAAGYIVRVGEIFKVEAHSISDSLPNTYQWKAVLGYDGSGTKTLQGGGTYDAYEIRMAEVLNQALVPSTYYMPMDAVRLPYALAAEMVARIGAQLGAFSNLSLNGSWTDESTGTYGVARYRQELGRIHTRGRIKITSSLTAGSAYLMFTYPVGKRPGKQIECGFVVYDGTDHKLGTVIVNTAGAASFIPQDNMASGVRIQLDQIPAFSTEA